MTDPTPKARWVDWPTPGLVYGDMRTGEVLAKVKMRAENDAMRTEAYDALVAAVRDADTLRQARQLAANFDQTSASRDWVLGTYGAAQTFFTLGDLLDLLSPPVSPDTPTPVLCDQCGEIHGTRPWCEAPPVSSDTPTPTCICPRFRDTGGFRIADLGCPVHGVEGTNPGDGPWDDDPPSPDTPTPTGQT